MNTTPTAPPRRKKLRYILPLVLIILIVLAAVLVPRYNRYLRERRAKEVRTALEAFRAAADQTWKTKGSISGITVEECLKTAAISPKVTAKWQFVIAWKMTDIYTTEMVDKLQDVNTNELAYVSPYKMVMAVAKAGNPVGEGIKIWYDGETNSYHGFGVDSRIEPDWSAVFPNP